MFDCYSSDARFVCFVFDHYVSDESFLRFLFYYYVSDLRCFCFCSFTKLVMSVFFVTTVGGGVS